MLIVAANDPAGGDASVLIGELNAALAAITGDSGANSFDAGDVRGARAAFVLARDDAGAAVGCGALRPLSAQVAELKRMYARPGSGAGAALLTALEARARELGYTELWLETRHVNLRAVQFYLRHGYKPIDNYGKYAGRAECACLGRRL
ncbi:MAG: GNAT family N-acetyltransferase [Massilia sp.]